MTDLYAIDDDGNLRRGDVIVAYVRPNEREALRNALGAPGGEPGDEGWSLVLGHEDRFHMWAHLFTVQQECEGHRAGQRGYDATLDHIYEEVTSALAYFEPAPAPSEQQESPT